MKNKIVFLSVSALLSLSLVACSSDADTLRKLKSQTETAQQAAVTSTTTATTTTSTQAATQQTTPAQQQDAPVNHMPAKIVSVTDGDTMKIKVNGKEETIRLLLVDTPETKHPNKPVQPFGPEASSFAKKTLEGKEVEIEIDVSERDKYGRLLAYLWVEGKMFNQMLLEKGLARVAYVYPPNVKYVDQFRKIQRKAQTAGIGIWSIENYAQENGFHSEGTTAAKSESPKRQPEKPNPAQVQAPVESSSSVYYKNCTEARTAGVTPIYKGDPGYSKKLDRDGDGVACE